MRGQPADREERHPARGQVLQEHRKLPHRPRGLDAVVGGVLGEVEHVGAVLEQRGIAFPKIQAPLVEFCEVGNEGDGRLPLALCEILHPCEEIRIGEPRDTCEYIIRVHASMVT